MIAPDIIRADRVIMLLKIRQSSEIFTAHLMSLTLKRNTMAPRLAVRPMLPMSRFLVE